MRPTTTFAIRPLTDADEGLVRTLLDKSACFWNQLNYDRLQNINEDDSIWNTADYRRVWNTTDYRKRFISILGSGTAQQIIRKNSEAWRSFVAAEEPVDSPDRLASGVTAKRVGSGGGSLT